MSAYLSLIGRRRGGRLFEAGRLLTFSAFRMGAYSRWALIRGWALIRINTVMPFAIKKGRFKLSTPAKCTSHVKLSKGGQSTNIKKS